jgi:hypothetical protein
MAVRWDRRLGEIHMGEIHKCCPIDSDIEDCPVFLAQRKALSSVSRRFNVKIRPSSLLKPGMAISLAAS